MRVLIGLLGLFALSATELVAQDTRPLTARGLENVVAFARLVGYVRFFHPADEAVRVNWSEFTVRGVTAVEAAPTADSLVATLRTLFAPVAPTVDVHRIGRGATRGPAAPGAVAPEVLGVIVWRHYGYAEAGAESEGVFLSARVRVPAPGGHVPSRVALAEHYSPSTGPDSMPVADPRLPLQVTLDGGVAASIPLAVWTVLPAVPDSLRGPPGVPPDWRASPTERAARMADVIAYWNYAQHFYPYFDVVDTDWPAALRTGLREAAVADPSRHIRVIRHLAAALQDGHAWVADTTRFPAYAALWLAMVQGHVVITAVGDSARESGVSIGDEVLTVDGRLVAEALAEEEAHASAASPQFRRMSALAELLAGAPGSTLRLSVRSPGQAPREVTIRHARGPARDKRPDVVTELEPGVLYLDWARLSSADSGSFLPKVRAARGLVVDMRGYPSRLDAFAFLDLLSDSALHSPPIGLPVISRPDRAGMFFRDISWPVERGKWGRPAHTPVVFVTYGGAISYAETIMGVVEGHQLGPIVGEATAGSNGNNNPIRLPTGLQVGLTALRVQKHDGSTLHGVGIIPTVPVERTLRGVREGKDEILERALEVLYLEIERRSTKRDPP